VMGDGAGASPGNDAFGDRIELSHNLRHVVDDRFADFELKRQFTTNRSRKTRMAE